jgi:hypothetical protein
MFSLVCLCLAALLFLLAALEVPTPGSGRFVPLGLFFLALAGLLGRLI